MGKIIKYKHHGVEVYVDEYLQGTHRENCLCFRCARFKPNTPENCDFAEQNYRACKIKDMVMPVFECKHFVFPKE
jgi:hypothetical protein